MKKTAKKMSVFQLTTMVAANMLGAGIIMLPTQLAEVGTISVLSWLVTALGSLILAYVFAEAGMFSTKRGGMGGYAEYRFGRLGHFIANYAYSISLMVANVGIAISAVGYAAVLFGVKLGPIQVAQATIILLWLAALLNFGGNRWTGRISNITVWGAIIPVILVGTIGWYWFDPELYWSAWNPGDLPFFDAVSASISMTLWAFLGFESAAANADAVENPKKNVPIATFFGTLVVAVIYVFSTNVMAGIVPNFDLLNSTAPFGLTFTYMFNGYIGKLVMATMIISCFGALLCWQFTISRVFKTCAEEGLFPKIFAHVNDKDAPIKGLLIILVVQSTMALATANESLYRQFENLVNLAVCSNVVPYILSCLAVPRLFREEGASLGRIKRTIPLLLIALIYCAYAIYATGPIAMVGSAVAISIGICIYLVAFVIYPRVIGARKKQVL